MRTIERISHSQTTSPEQKDHLRLLVQELRSDKHVQSFGCLAGYQYKGVGYTPVLCFCVLGVAVQVYKDAHPELEWEPVNEDRFGLLGDSIGLAPEISEWYNLDRDGRLWDLSGREEGPVDLMGLNDRDHMSFAQLADLIEWYFGL